MNMLAWLYTIKGMLDFPTTMLFFAVSVILTFKTRFIQIRAIHRFI